MPTITDETAFASVTERHRRELQLHCYRMLGSFEDSEDLVQETFLRAWRARSSLDSEEPRALRAWLYRIATNACLDALRTRPRRVLASQLGPARHLTGPAAAPVDLPWLQPYPTHLLEDIAPPEEQPDEVVVSRETVEIAFLAALQLLPPRQRATLILRDVLGWRARDVASLLDTSVAAINSALQRARATMRHHLPERRLKWRSTKPPSEEERAVLTRFMEALERADGDAIAELLREDARADMPPFPFWHDGREMMMAALRSGLEPGSPEHMGRWRMVPADANMQPATAGYLMRPGDTVYRAFALDILRIENGKVAEITAFLQPGAETNDGSVEFGFDVFRAFGLPLTV